MVHVNNVQEQCNIIFSYQYICSILTDKDKCIWKSTWSCDSWSYRTCVINCCYCWSFYLWPSEYMVLD